MLDLLLCVFFIAVPLVFLLAFVVCLILFLAHHGFFFDFFSKIFIPVTVLCLLLFGFFMFLVPSASAGFFDSLGFGSSSCSSSLDADPEAPPREEASQNASQESSQEASQEASQETAQEEASQEEQEVGQEKSQEKSQEGSQEEQEAGQEKSQEASQEEQEAGLANLLNRIFYEVSTIRRILTDANAEETGYLGTAEASDEPSADSDMEPGAIGGDNRGFSDSSVSADSSDSRSSYDSSDSSAEADVSASAEDIPPEVTLLTIHTDIWLLLFTFWGFAGLFFAFKVGGVLLGRL